MKEFLLRNSTKFVYRETPEESLFSIVRCQDQMLLEIQENEKSMERMVQKKRGKLIAQNKMIQTLMETMLKDGKSILPDIERLLSIPHT